MYLSTESGIELGREIQTRMGYTDMYVVRLKAILKFSDLFHRIGDAAVPLKKTVIGDRLILGAAVPIQNGSYARYHSHSIRISNAGTSPLGVSVRVPYIGNSIAESKPFEKVLEPNNQRGLMLEGSELTAYQQNDTLMVFEDRNGDGELVDGLRLIELEPYLISQTAVLKEHEEDYAVSVSITVNYRSVEGMVVPDLKFYFDTSKPTMRYLAGGGLLDLPSIIQLPDEGYPYVSVDMDPKTKYGVLNWHNSQGKVAPVRIRSLEDSDNRLVLPALHYCNAAYKKLVEDVWVESRFATQFGYDEDNSTWCLFRHSAPYAFKGYNQSWWDRLPNQVDATTPVMLYSRKRPTQLVSELPNFPLKELPPAVAMKHLRIAG